MNLPKKINKFRRCTTHFHACDCREYRYEEMEQALKIIRTWASVASQPEFEHNATRMLEQITDKVVEALQCLED